MSRGEGSGWDVVGLSIDEDALVATDDRVARYADDALGEVELACMRVGCDGSAKVRTSMNDDELSPMRIAEVVGESFGEGAWVARRNRRGIADPAGADQHEQLRRPENRSGNDEPEDRREWYEHAACGVCVSSVASARVV
jgi:hypothetical protein